MQQINPFTPLSGSVPNVWAGRELILSQIKQALLTGVNNPYLSTLFVGPRGTGKSSLLNFATNVASELGWISAYCLAEEDLLQSVISNAQYNFKSLYADAKISINKITIAGVLGLEIALDEPDNTSLDAKLTGLVKDLSASDIGLLIAVDEVTPEVEAMRKLVFIVQQLQAKGYKIALYMSGLPEHINSLLNGSSTSYLRRSMKYYTSFVEDVEVEKTLQQTAKAAGKAFSQDALAKATEAIGGYPYLIQFVGYWCWVCSQEARVIDTDMVDAALKIAIPEYEKNVLEQALSSLSEKDILVLKALSAGTMTQSELAEALGLSRGYLAVYKKRLLDKGLIEQGASKRLEIRLPHLARFVEDFEL